MRRTFQENIGMHRSLRVVTQTQWFEEREA